MRASLPTGFLFYEVWKSKEALDVHLQTPPLKGLFAVVDEILAEPPEVTLWQAIS